MVWVEDLLVWVEDSLVWALELPGWEELVVNLRCPRKPRKQPSMEYHLLQLLELLVVAIWQARSSDVDLVGAVFPGQALALTLTLTNYLVGALFLDQAPTLTLTKYSIGKYCSINMEDCLINFSSPNYMS